MLLRAIADSLRSSATASLLDATDATIGALADETEMDALAERAVAALSRARRLDEMAAAFEQAGA